MKERVGRFPENNFDIVVVKVIKHSRNGLEKRWEIFLQGVEKWISNKQLTTHTHTQDFGLLYANTHCCTAEANTTLERNYPPI